MQQRIIEAVKSRYRMAKNWTGRPGYLGFGLLGLGTFISGLRHDQGMGLLFVTAIISFIGELVRLIKQKGGL